MKKSVSFNTVQFIIHPPIEEAYSEPCLSYAPDEDIQGIPIEAISISTTPSNSSSYLKSLKNNSTSCGSDPILHKTTSNHDDSASPQSPRNHFSAIPPSSPSITKGVNSTSSSYSTTTPSNGILNKSKPSTLLKSALTQQRQSSTSNPLTEPIANARVTSPASIPLPSLSSFAADHHSINHINAVSCCYSLAQLLGSLPFMHHELPFESPDAHIHDFVALMKDWHTTSDTTSVKDMFEAYLNKHWGMFVPTSEKDSHLNTDPASPSKEEQIKLMQVPGIVDIEYWFRGLMDHVVFKTRFGRRFEFGLKSQLIANPLVTTTTLSSSTSITAASAFTAPGIEVNEFVQEIKSQLFVGPLRIKDEEAGFVKEQFVLEIPMDGYLESDTLPLITLLNHRLSQSAPIFFAGGNSLPNPLSSNHQKRNGITPPKTQFTNLPGFLALYFNRSPEINPDQPSVPKYHAPSIELPMEIDLGFYLDADAPLPTISHSKRFGSTSMNRQQQQENDNPLAAASPSFYRLHGFCTQLNGFFITYTRLRSQFKWFKCTGGKVEEVDLGTRVSSRGVMLAIYCLQDAV